MTRRSRGKGWTSAPSRGRTEFTPEEAEARHLGLKNYLTARRLRVSRLTTYDSVLEAESIAGYLDYLRWLERPERKKK